jgi:hypothetical protein
VILHERWALQVLTFWLYSLSVGSNLAALPTPFPAWDGAHWNREIVGSYTKYLQTVYSESSIVTEIYID